MTPSNLSFTCPCRRLHCTHPPPVPPTCNDGAFRPGQKLVATSSVFTPASIIASPLPPPQPPPDSPIFHPTVCFHPTMATHSTNIIPRADDMPEASSPIPPDTSHNQDSPRHFSLPAEEDVLGLEEDVLGLPFTEFPPGSLFSGCAGATSPCTVPDLALYEDVCTDKIRAQLPVPASLQDSLVHIVGRPRVCGIFNDTTRVYAFTHTDTTTPTRGLFDSGTNLCMTNNPNLLVDVRACPPFTISLATTDGSHSHKNVCQRCGLLPLPLLDGTTYYQTWGLVWYSWLEDLS